MRTFPNSSVRFEAFRRHELWEGEQLRGEPGASEADLRCDGGMGRGYMSSASLVLLARALPRGVIVSRTRHPAFTLIEVLVVVAIIALLVAILLPSLAGVREQARSSQCLSNCKQLAMGVHYYASDNRGSMPGPVHNPVYHCTYLLKTYSQAAHGQEWWYESSLPYFLEKYLGDRSRSALVVDAVATCPSVAKIKKFPDPPMGANRAACLPVGHYIANSNGGTNATRRTGSNIAPHPYRGTRPGFYFGWSNVPVSNTADNWKTMADENRLPKKLDGIERSSQEWMIADLWAWGRTRFAPGTLYSGTWSYSPAPGPWVGLTSVTDQSGRARVPTHPFHMTLRSFDPEDYNDISSQSPRLTAGKTNQSYFDGHAEGVRRWTGSVNPCLQEDAAGKPSCR